MRLSQTTQDKITNIVVMISILGCIIVLSMSIFLAIVLVIDFTNGQLILGNLVLYAVNVLGWFFVLLGIGDLGLGWKRTGLQRILSGFNSCENCGCISGIPIVLGLLIWFLYHAFPVGMPFDYFYTLPLFANVGMALLGVTFLIYKEKLKATAYIVYIGILYIAIGAGNTALYFSGFVPMSGGLMAWFLLASGPIFMVPLILVFVMERKVIPPQQP